jgi:hypothetical protein
LFGKEIKRDLGPGYGIRSSYISYKIGKNFLKKHAIFG